MLINSSQQVQVFYEIAMSIGNSLDLPEMLKTSLLAYLHKLNCSAGIVLRFINKPNDNIIVHNEFSIPYTIELNNEYKDIVNKIPANFTNQTLTEFIEKLPYTMQIGTGKYLYFFHLPDFGLLILIKNETGFSHEIVLSLAEINNKLANACIACIQKQSLEESELRFKNLTSLLPEMICETDLTGKITFANLYAITKMGFTSEAIAKGVNVFDIFANEHKEKAIQFFQESLSTDNLPPREYLIKKNNGDIFPGVVYTSRIIEKGAPVGIRGVLVDITDRINYEKKLKENSERLEMALLGSGSGFWDWNIETGEVYFNDRWASMLGYETSEIKPNVSAWQDILHPDDRWHTDIMLEKHLNGETPFYNSEHRLKAKDGSWKWILDTGKVIERNNDGKPMRAVGTHLDITKQKSYEIELEKNFLQQEMLAEIAINLNSLDNFDHKLNHVLKIIGEHLDVSRVYIFKDDPGGESTSNTFEWCNRDINPQLENLQGIPYSVIPSWKKIILGEGVLFNQDISILPDDLKEILEPQSIQSIIVYPITISGKYAGFIGFDECVIKREWSKSELQLLRTVSGIISNSFERLSVEKSLSESEETNRAIISALPDMLFHFSKSGILLNYNFVPTNISVFNDVVINKNLNRLFPKNIVKQIKQAIEECLKQGTFIFEFASQFEHGTILFEARLSKVNSDQVILLLRDVTQNREYEANLKKAIEKAEMANKAKSEFLANMSHEIRTPMNAILGFSEALIHKIPDEAHKRMLKSILSSGNILLSLINDILDMSKIEAGKIEFDYQPVNIRNLILEVTNIFSEKACKKALSLIKNVDTSVPELLKLDEIRIRQILLNLVGNAIKFTEQGFVQINVIYDPQTQNLGKLKIEIEDSGIGIPESQQTIIFEAFRQQSGQSNRKYEGTGLGLAITKKLVEKMNGNVLLNSTQGKGSCFIIEIENVEEISSSGMPAKQEEVIEDKIDFEEATIMIVDDIRTNIVAIENLLDYPKLKFVEAESGEIAIEILNHHLPDLILMDIRMTGLDGVETTSIIKDNKLLKHIPVIAFTASVFETDKLRVNKIFDGLLIKPVNKHQLLLVLKKYLKFNLVQEQTQNIETVALAEMSEEAILQIPELVNLLTGKFLPQWELIKNKLLIFKIEEFHNHLYATTQNYDIPLLKAYLDKFKTAIEVFDLENIDKLLKSFPAIIEELSNIYNSRII